MSMIFLLWACSQEQRDTKQPQDHSDEDVILSYEECFPHLVEHFDGIYEDISTATLAPECSGISSQSLEILITWYFWEIP